MDPAPVSPQVVTQTDLERRLAELAGRVPDPEVGLFGPGSRVWTVNRHAAMFLAGGRAALLQIAHPAVAQAIAQHSHTRTDPLGRFQRTFRQVFSMVWGDLDSALGAARRVHAIHTRIVGTFDEEVGRHAKGATYQANDRSSLLWVHATLWETSILVYETFVEKLGEDAKESYYQETRRFAALFGLEEAELPPTWPDFLDYNREMWGGGDLAIGKAGAEIADYLFRAPDMMLDPAFDALRLLTVHFLPADVREAFGFDLSPAETDRVHRLTTRLRRLLTHLPGQLRFVPPYLEAQTRLGIRRRSFLDPLLHRIYVGA